MPLIASTVSLADYKKVLAKDLQLAETRALPFRLYQDYTFEDGKKGPLLVIGKPAKEILTGIGERAKAVKGLGLCRSTEDGLNFQVKTGSIKRTDLNAAMKAAGRSDVVQIVAELEAGAGSDDTSAIDQRLPDLLHDLGEYKKLDGVEDEDWAEFQQIIDKLQKIKGGKAKGNAEELLDALEMGLTGAWEEATTRLERANRLVDSSIDSDSGSDVLDLSLLFGQSGERSKPIAKRPEWQEAVSVMEELMTSLNEALEWQKKEVESEQQAEEMLPDAQNTLQQLRQAFQQAETKVSDAQDYLNDLRDELHRKKNVQRNARNQGFWNKMQGEINAVSQDITWATNDLSQKQRTLRTARKALNDQDNLVNDLRVISTKHGTGRHGAQTGIEGQARRSATGGTTADQHDNPYGLPKARLDDEGNELLEISWKEIKLTWKVEGKKRVIVNREEIEHALTQYEEDRFQGTNTSSLFHSPQLEKEAVERAVAYADEHCIWEEIKEGNKWKPLKRVLIIIGKPADSVGWGTSLKSDSTTPLADANEALDQFHKGAISMDEMLASLDVVFETDKTGGVKMVPTARVMLDRTSSGWVNTSQYPYVGAPGWTIAGKQVRRQNGSGNWIVETAGAGNDA